MLRLDVMNDISNTEAYVAFVQHSNPRMSPRMGPPVEGTGGACHSGGVQTLLTAEDRPWQDIPAVAWVGILMGLGFLIVAIRAMFKKR